MIYKRSGFVYITLIALLSALIIRIFYISCGFMNPDIKSVAGSRSAKITLYNTKGLIYDRNLKQLAGNQKCKYLIISPREFDKSNINYLSQITDTPIEIINNKLKEEGVFVLKTFMSPQSIKGVYIFDGATRYPESSVCQHILGYLDSDGIVGVSGIEKAYNEELSTFNSRVTLNYSADATRGIIAGLGFNQSAEESEITNGIVLTLDKKLAEFSEKALKKYVNEGAIVIMDANNGEILSLSSFPTFEQENISSYTDSSLGELINNAITNQTVGSVFKIIIAASAMINNIDSFTYNCNGGISVENRTIICQNNNAHGYQTLEDAFSNSCNSYFIALGQLLGYDRIVETAELFGVDSSIELCKNIYSSSALIPENRGTLSVANLSIGQGELMISPLSITRITAAICNGGFLVNPQIYKNMYINGKNINEPDYNYRTQIVSSSIAEKIRKMCVQCVEIGTGKNAMPNHLGAGGKTASAQTGKYIDSKEILNTYFTGFYPAENPKYVITIFAKNGKSGSQTCAPVFKEICDFIHENY